MPPKRTSQAVPTRPEKKRRVTAPRPKMVALDFDNTINLIAFLLDDALQGNGREAPFYHGLQEAFAHLCRGTREMGTRVTLSAQYALCEDTYPEVEVTREEPIATRSTNINGNHQVLDDEDHTLANQTLSTVVSDSSDGSLVEAQENYRAPDFILWKAVFQRIGNRIGVSKLPFAVVEVKPPKLDILDDLPDMKEIVRAVRATRQQVEDQLVALWQEFRAVPAEAMPFIFVFIFVGKYFAHYKIRHGVTDIPGIHITREGYDRHISCLLNEDETDFSDMFQRRWKEMMDTYSIEMVPGFLRV